MMRCPKCGSEVKKFRGYLICSNSKCLNKRGFNSKDLKEIEYQARLDKVLSKFEVGKENKDYRYLKYKGELFIDYLIGDGYFDLWIGNKPLRLSSLKTVESLLKDLEAQDE